LVGNSFDDTWIWWPLQHPCQMTDASNGFCAGHQPPNARSADATKAVMR
jgi:hypothetical protein